MDSAIGGKAELSLKMAGDSLSKMLVGSYFDCFSVSSIPVSLKFINDNVFPGKSLYVDVDFSCDAVMGCDSCKAIDDSVEGFFTRRAKFLADLYSCIGREVADIHLEVDGSLAISIGGSVITMQLAQEEKGQEDSVWKVEMEMPVGHLMSTVNSVMCVPKADGVSFLS
ncbi:hypothetical protein [Xanthomonas bundabergensis]|uniref:hypothetical protein n=1 Tax=Xanthomonas bundabergensis TaxID=3160842 RepID=UPI003513913F